MKTFFISLSIVLILASCTGLSRIFTEDSYPAVSPCGHLIVFSFNVVNGEDENYPPSGLYVINIDGTGEKLLSPYDIMSGLPATASCWSPDGRQIVTTKGIYTIKNSTVTDFRPINDDIKSLSWSPDGKTILYNSFDSKIFLCDTLFNNIRELPFEADYPRWMPDGQHIVCLIGSEIYITDTLGIDMIRLNHNGYYPVPSPDGSLIAFMNSMNNICIMTSDGANLRVLDKGEYPAWTPDSKYIVYTKPKANKLWDSYYIWKISIDGKEIKQITKNKAFI